MRLYKIIERVGLMQLDGLSNQWSPGPALPVIDGRSVHVWRIPLVLPAGLPAGFAGCLSADELARAQRFRFDVHRERFIAAHACLRDILGRYLRLAPEAVRFQISQYGKPFLEDEQVGLGLTFNLSHSHELGLVAIAVQSAVGIDIEHVRVDLADELVARRFFSEHEVEAYLSLPEDLRKEAFFNCWTRKEAYIKAIGEGLSMPLDQFDVTLTPGEPVKLIATRPDPAQALQWNLYALYPGNGYAAALAVKGSPAVLHFWRWTPNQPA
jgi:4'-phosphopantetheinyl transferase